MAHSARLLLTFEDVAIYFTEQEWQKLETWQKELYQHVMRTNYETLVSLDDGIPKPELIYWIEQGRDPFKKGEESQKSENIICSSADRHFDPVTEGQLFWERQQTVNGGEIKCHFQLDPLPIQYSFGCLLDPKCSKTFLQNNMQTHQCQKSRERPVSSPASKTALSEKSELSSVHSKEKLSQSPDCDEIFLLRKDTEALQHNHFGERPFSCPKCSKYFPTRAELAKHFKVHTEEKLLQCLKCNKSFHLSTLHTDEKPFLCPECDVTHHFRHTREKPFTCNECGRGFATKYRLCEHLRVHSGEKPFKCPLCDKSFSVKRAVKAHLVTHSKEKPFSCGECGRRYTRQAKLTEHFRVHTGERPFQCPKCDKSFRRKSQLLSHESMHTGKKAFHCPCGKNFRERGHLLLHQRIHRPERPFSCRDCGKRFTFNSNLTKHIRVHTKSCSASSKSCSALDDPDNKNKRFS